MAFNNSDDRKRKKLGERELLQLQAVCHRSDRAEKKRKKGFSKQREARTTRRQLPIKKEFNKRAERRFDVTSYLRRSDLTYLDKKKGREKEKEVIRVGIELLSETGK